MAWWNDSWPYRLPISVDTSVTGANIAGDVDNATVLIKLHSGNFQDFFLVKEDLSDIRFLAGDDQTVLAHQVESFDVINQLIYVWVKLPSVKGNLASDRLWMYYGNLEAPPVAAPQLPYSDQVAAVYHFADVSGGVIDSTANANNTTLTAGEGVSSSMIAQGIQFNGTGAIQTAPLPQVSDPETSGMTVSFWVKAGQPTEKSVVAAIGDETQSLAVVVDQGQLLLSANGALESERLVSLTPDNWHQVVVTYQAGTANLLMDGNIAGKLDGLVLPVTPKVAIGASLTNESPFVGAVDELRIDAVLRSNPDLKLQLASQSLAGNLLSYQQGEQLGAGGGGSGFWSVIIGSTESSGWTIVALLGVMAAVSWMVMLGKALFIRNANKDNSAFLEQYRTHAGEDPALLDHKDSEDDKELDDSPILQAVFGDHDHFQSSPIYRVYHRGIQEVSSRLGTSVGARAAGLSRSSLDAIKAAIDAQMIREAQRLNSKMVLLTIAISGGPFLGLMGTVVGVMITFAAIAASGDVNISAIAPGVAAALLTTVAGLVVAIPALFGYNYLATQIKENISDMRVFSDEFITRLAEYYGN